jgi:UDP-N-acetylmuramyl tripeptide synthase
VTWAGAGLNWKNDAAGCPQCAGRIIFQSGGGNDWKCDDCGLSRPVPDIWTDETPAAPPGGRALLASGESYDIGLQLPGRCNQANAVTVLAAVGALGYPLDQALAAMAAVRDVAGRYATVETGGATARLLLAKNPAGWAEVFDMLAPPPAPLVVAINARRADGHDPSWLWDVPFERLAGRQVVATGERYRDLAVRLLYAGVDHTCEPDLMQALAAATTAVTGAAGGGAPVDVVANYTAFSQLRARVGGR